MASSSPRGAKAWLKRPNGRALSEATPSAEPTASLRAAGFAASDEARFAQACLTEEEQDGVLTAPCCLDRLRDRGECCLSFQKRCLRGRCRLSHLPNIRVPVLLTAQDKGGP